MSRVSARGQRAGPYPARSGRHPARRRAKRTFAASTMEQPRRTSWTSTSTSNRVIQQPGLRGDGASRLAGQQRLRRWPGPSRPAPAGAVIAGHRAQADTSCRFIAIGFARRAGLSRMWPWPIAVELACSRRVDTGAGHSRRARTRASTRLRRVPGAQMPRSRLRGVQHGFGDRTGAHHREGASGAHDGRAQEQDVSSPPRSAISARRPGAARPAAEVCARMMTSGSRAIFARIRLPHRARGEQATRTAA